MIDIGGTRILVTGGSGFIGCNLLPALLTRNAEVHVIVREKSNLSRIREVIPGITLYRHNLCDGRGTARLLRSINPEFIFHLAKTGGRPDDDPVKVFKTNVTGTFALLQAAREAGCRSLIHFGSSMEYGPKKRAMKEDDVLDPATFYGASKAAASFLVQSYAKKHIVHATILRLFGVYGCWDAPWRLIPTAIRAALNGEELAMTPPGYRRDWLFVEDVVDASLLALESRAPSGSVINIGSGRDVTHEHVVKTIERLVGKQIRLRKGAYPPRVWDVTCWRADTRNAERLLGWRPKHTLRSGLEKTISWTLNHLS